MKRVVLIAAGLFALVAVGRAQLVFSGLALFSSDAAGAQSGAYWWDNVGGHFTNIYYFSSTPGSVFRTSGNTTGSLDANLSLTAGTREIYFAANDVANTGYVGLNFYFDSDFTDTSNRISAFVADNGSTSFSVISGGTTTYGQLNTVGSSGSLSYTSGGFTVTLSGLTVAASGVDYVTDVSASPGLAANDTVGHITLTVTAVPEPVTMALGCGLTALGFAGGRRWRVRSRA